MEISRLGRIKDIRCYKHRSTGSETSPLYCHIELDPPTDEATQATSDDRTMDLSNLKGQTAVITGAARGLGLTFASVLARANCNIAVLDILETPSNELLDLREKHSVKVEYYVCNITSREQINTAISRIENDFGSINININAAGIVRDVPFLTTTDDDIAKTFAVNFNGSFLVAQACANSMVKRITKSHQLPVDPSECGGSIVFISSISTHTPSMAQNISAYVGSKAAIRGLVKPLAIELAPYGIRCNSLSPGYMMTDMMAGLQKQQPDLVRQFQKETLLGGGTRIGKPEELQGPLLMLCSKAGAWVTGQDILVDGGAASWKHAAVLSP